jgi:hypothetical protein
MVEKGMARVGIPNAGTEALIAAGYWARQGGWDNSVHGGSQGQQATMG